MKIRDVINFDSDNLSASGPGITRDQGKQMATGGQALNRVRLSQQPMPLQDTPADVDPIDGLQSNLPPALNPSVTSVAQLSTPHRRDLDFIKGQLLQVWREHFGRHHGEFGTWNRARSYPGNIHYVYTASEH